ncbi:MAG: right-handed parallel beta-helix repeat-containing protein [Verrucomicrobiota bacterium]
MRITTSDDWQLIIDANHAGTTYRIESGEHRLQSCTPKDGDTFIGDFGAYMKGSKLLDSTAAQLVGGVWVFSGQTQSLLKFDDGMPRATQIGNDLFLDGLRLLHVETRSDVDQSGEFYFDELSNEIVMFDDPLGRKIEAVVDQSAFYLEGLTGVTLMNFTIMHYGSIFRPEGAVQGRLSYDTVVKYMEFRDNHALGLALGPGTLVANCRFFSQGLMGAAGGGQIEDGPLLPIIVRDTEFVDNNSIRDDWQTSGAEGAVKITYTKGSILENCWVHDNWTYGVWYDIENEGSIIRSNLIENTTTDLRQSRSIYFEISGNADDPAAARSLIYWNIIRSSGETSVDISSSSNVHIYENAILDAIIGVTVRDNLRGQRNADGFLEGVSVYDNEIEASRYFARASDSSSGGLSFIDVYDSNTYFGSNTSATIDSVESTNVDWQTQTGFGLKSNWQNSGTPSLPDGATGFTLSHYGPKLWDHDFEVSLDQTEGAIIASFLSLKEMGILQRAYTYKTDLESSSWLPILPIAEVVVEDLGNYERIEATFDLVVDRFFLSLSYTGL